MLIRNVEIDGEIIDVRVANGRIAEKGKLPGQADVDGQGGALLPGLHDHHIHLNATAAALNSVRCGPSEVKSGEELSTALSNAPGKEWIRGIGYHHSVAGEIDRDWLDANGPDRPIRIQHRGGRMWIFNSQAIELLDAEIPADGRLVDGDHSIRTSFQTSRPDLGPLVDKLLSYGITGVTEVTPKNIREDFEHYLEMARPLRLSIMGCEDLTGIEGVGALKLHYHDYNLPALDDLAYQISNAHEAGRPVASHCVTRSELMLTLAALEQAGSHPGDRIEHAAIADATAIDWMVKLGVTVVTQPHFIQERGDAYLKDVDSHDLPHLWRLKSFSDAGLKLAAGSDAPFGDPNPWKAMDASVNRPTGFDQGEVITPEEALALYTKPVDDAAGAPRKIRIGATADMCLLDRSWTKARKNLVDVSVLTSWIGGKQVYSTISSTKPHSSAV